MKKLIRLFFIGCIPYIFICCGHKDDIVTKMDQIKRIGDSHPQEALAMLDSLTIQVREESEYVQMKHDLLKLRLEDKAYIAQKSDLIVKKVLPYFEKNGSDEERQEAFYYAGSVYRDLQDTPKALECYFKAEETFNNSQQCDSVILRNTYSQIHVLMYSVQNYEQAFEYALKEYDISERINKIDLTSLNHVGISYFCLDSLSKAKEWFGKELDLLLKQQDLSGYSDNVYSLLYNFSLIKDKKRAATCYEMTKQIHDEGVYTDKYIALGEYYQLTGQTDSAIVCYRHRINDNNLFNKYDATKALFKIYYGLGLTDEATDCARLFIEASDTLDLGKRQELAATINNQYKYHLDKNKELKLKEDQERQRSWLMFVSSGAVIVIALLILTLLYRKNRHLKETVRLSSIAERHKVKNDKLQQAIDDQLAEIRKKEKELTKLSAELEKQSNTILRVQSDLKEKQKELETNKSILDTKIEQNKSLFSLIHKVELEKDAKEVVNAIKKSSSGIKNMTSSEWNQLYVAIDELYPDFKALLNDKLGKFSEKQMKVCYLMKIGLSNSQIMNTTGLPKTTVWRWVNNYSWILDEKS